MDAGEIEGQRSESREEVEFVSEVEKKLFVFSLSKW